MPRACRLPFPRPRESAPLAPFVPSPPASSPVRFATMPLGLINIGRQLFKRGRKGLYAGRMTRFGNKVSEDGENKCAGWMWA